MSESRDANDPRDQMRGLRKEERAAFEREEASDTGGQEHASSEDREGVLPGRRRRPVEAPPKEKPSSAGERTGADAPQRVADVPPAASRREPEEK